MRSLVRETHLTVKNLVLPLFITEGEGKMEAINSMPGQFRRSVDMVVPVAHEARKLGIAALALFPAIAENQKDRHGSQALDSQGLVPRALALLRREVPEMLLITDIALDPYNSQGHDGLVGPTGEIQNDATVEILAKMAVLHAQCGAQVVAPSDMMDGRVGAMRRALDEAGFYDTAILSYAVKYASAFYGPFREALQSAPKSGDKKTYQMDPANSREALREAGLDILEGADILMVKPAGSYLDIVQSLAQNCHLPVAAYQVSGEYSMIMAAAEKGYIDGEACMMESLLGIRRAGAQWIFTYFALEAARQLTRQS